MLLTYFKHSNYNIRWYFNPTISQHMVDNFICSQKFFFQVKYYKVVNIGIRSDHTAVQTNFKITEIKFKLTDNIVTYIYWNLIGYHKKANELFNNILSMSVEGSTTYYDLNNYILHDGSATATTNNQNNKGWFHFICDFLLPLIDTRDALLYYHLTLGIGKGESSQSNLQLSALQLAVSDAIALSKVARSAYQAEKTYSM